VSFLGAGLLPLISGWEEFARLSPWYYINSGDPLRNGLDIGAVAILGGSSAVFVLLAWIGINRRDLRSRSVNTRILDRLRGNTFTAHLVERVAGRTLISKIWIKTISQFQALTLMVAIFMFGLMGLVMGPIYAYMGTTMSQLADSYPPEIIAFFGGGDFGTVEGFFQLETFGLMAPLAIMVVTIAIGAKSIAGEEKDQTLGLLLANPVSRSYVLTQKLIAMFIWGFVVAFATYAGVALANLLFNLGMDYLNILAICVQLLILGYLFGGIAALMGAAFGRVGLAIGVSAGGALALQVVNGMAEINNGWWEEFTPFYWYNGTDPLNNGFSITGIIILAIATGITISASYPLLNRRDLRG
jgi:ABC-2 type transport system permease protein